MLSELKELWRFRELLRQMLARELKIRYKNSFFGFLWSIVPPLLQVVVYTFLVRGVFSATAKNYSAYALCGLIPWTFFQTAILDSCQSLLANYGVIRKIYLPREIIPLSYILSNMIHFVLGWAVYFVVFAVILRFFGLGIPLLPSMLWFPVIILVESLLVTGLSLWMSALNVFYEDIKFLLATLFNLMFFCLPILYPADVVYYSEIVQRHPWLYKLYLLNPISGIITAFRKTILEPESPGSFVVRLQGKPALPMDWTMFGLTAMLSLGIAIAGYSYFNYKKWQFVERP